jgi:hypothetical protein
MLGGAMARGILYVESHPVSPERADEYNKWYDEVHIPEIVALDGFVSARRFAPNGDGPYIAIYEIEADDVQGAMGVLGEAASSGKMQMSDAMRMDPPPTIRIHEEISSSG